MLVRAKICGIRRLEDLDVAVSCGADAVGVISGITHISEDNLSPDGARDIVRRVPPFVSTVLVTHLLDATEILELGSHVGADTIQVHGLVDLETTRTVFEHWHGRITKAVHVTGPTAVDDALAFVDVCHAIHLDSRTPDRLGGTGQTHDWSISRTIRDRLLERGHRCILAGGLTAGNVESAIDAVLPYAVDVNSGVEDRAGDKALEQVARFVELAHGARSDRPAVVQA